MGVSGYNCGHGRKGGRLINYLQTLVLWLPWTVCVWLASRGRRSGREILLSHTAHFYDLFFFFSFIDFVLNTSMLTICVIVIVCKDYIFVTYSTLPVLWSLFFFSFFDVVLNTSMLTICVTILFLVYRTFIQAQTRGHTVVGRDRFTHIMLT